MSIRHRTRSYSRPTRNRRYRRSAELSPATDEEGPLRDDDPRFTSGHRTTTLFAALNLVEGKFIGRCMQRHRRQEFIRFLNAVEADTPVSKFIHIVLDNYATHQHPKVQAWLAGHPRFVFYLTPKSRLTGRQLKRGVFRSIVDLPAAVNRFLAETNADPKPFVWTANPDRVIAALQRAMQALESGH